MGNVLKIILYIGTGLFALCVGFILIVPGLMDWNQYKGQIVDRVAHELGREFAVSGDISLSVIPETKFSLKGVHIGSIEGASVPRMVQVESVDVEVAFVPLLMGSIQIVRVILVEPAIVFETLADGRSNWIWGEDGKEGSRLFSGEFLEDVSLEEFVISAGNFEYLDAPSGQRYQIEDVNLSMSASSLSGPFQFNGVLRAFGSEVMVESISVEVNSQNNILTRGQISSQGFQLKYSASSKTTLEGVPSWGGTVNIYPNGETGLPIGWSKLWESLLGVDSMNPDFSQLTSDFVWEGGVLDFSELEFRVGELKGTAVVSLGSNRVSGRVDLGPLNLDKVLNSEAFMGDEQIVVEMVSKITESISSLSNRPSLVVDAILVADSIQYKGETIRDVVVNADINDGVIRLNQCSASFPGASSLALEGQFYLEQDSPGFLGTAEGSSDNLRALLKWLSVELGPLPGERLRRLLFSTKIQGTLASGNLTAIDIQLDTSRIEGGVNYLVSNGRAGLGIGLSVDQLDLDAYLPQVSPRNGDVTSANSSYITILSAFDANLDVHLKEVTANGIPVSDVILNGLWQRGILDVEEISVGDFLGSSIKFTGILKEFSSNPSIQGSFSAEAKKLGSLGRVFPEVNELPQYLLGPIAVELAVQGDIDQMAMDGFVEVLQNQIALRGSIVDFINNGKVDISAEVQVASLAEFGSLLSTYGIAVPELVLGADIPVTLGAEVAGVASNLDLGAVAMAGGGLLEAKGTVAKIDRVLEFDLHGDFRHPNIGDFVEIFARKPMPALFKVGTETAVDMSVKGGLTKFIWEGKVKRGDLEVAGYGSYGAGGNDMSLVLQHPDFSAFVSEFGAEESGRFLKGPIDFSIILQSSLAGIKVPNLEVTTPASDLYGNLAIREIGGEQKLVGAFTSGKLDLNELSSLVAVMGPSNGAVPNHDGTGAPSPLVVTTQAGDAPVSWDGLTADLVLEVAVMRGLGQKFESVDAKLNIMSQSINIEHFSGLWGGGNFGVKGTLSSNPDPGFDVVIILEDADLEEVLVNYGGFGPFSGRVTLEATLTAEGETKEQRLASLSGKGRITGTAGGSVGGISFTEFTEEARGLDQVGDFINLVPTILGEESTLFTGFDGNFEAGKGKIRTEDLVFMLDKGKAAVSGVIDLGAWTQDLEVKTILTDHDLSLPIKVYITGDIGTPAVGVRIPELETYLRSVFPEARDAPDAVREIIQDAGDIVPEQVLEGVGSLGDVEDLIERLIQPDSSQQSHSVEDNSRPGQFEDNEFRDLLEQLLQD
ncbi:MAG: AsmA family protein [Pseudomonadota bacterium]|nr:AsmA family protein [Pseudomonadota bacterium]